MEENKAQEHQQQSQQQQQQLQQQQEGDDFFFGIQRHGDMTEEEFQDHLQYLENHPLFMKSVPDDLSQNENLEAIQNLVFNDEPENIANYCNERGNLTWKKGPNEKYFLHEAIKSYDEGINQDFNDDQVKAKMWSNKALMQFKLKNYRDCIQSCQTAIKLNPTFIKAYYRCAMSYFIIERYQESLNTIVEGMKIEKNKELQALKEQVEKKVKEIKEKEMQRKNKELIEKNELYSQLASKNIVLGKSTIQIPGAYQQSVFVDEYKKVHIPICLLYPEFSQMDFIQVTQILQIIFNYIKDSIEDDQLYAQLEVAFQEGLPWEQENPQKYYSQLSDIEAYIELNSTEQYYQLAHQKTFSEKGFYKINLTDDILTILQQKNHIIPMVLQLYIISKKSPFYNIFIGQNKIFSKIK